MMNWLLRYLGVSSRRRIGLPAWPLPTMPTAPVVTTTPTAPVVTAPVVTAPVATTPTVSTTPTTPTAPVTTAPTTSTTSKPLAGTVRVVLAMHSDGLTKMATSSVSGWIDAATNHAKDLQARGFPASWEFTGKEIALLEAMRPGWLASLGAYGVTVAPREPHEGEGTAQEAADALSKAGAPVASYIGSCLDASDYAAGPWPIITGEGTLGHTSDSDWSGVRRLSPSVVLVGSGTADSVAIKRGIVKDTYNSIRTWAGEVVRYNMGDPATGAAPWFVSPARHDGTQAPVPILDDVDRLLADITKDGTGATLMWTTYDELVQAWKAGGEPVEYTVEKS